MSRGRFGDYGGQYISETLMNELINLEEKYDCGMINNYEWDRLTRHYQELIKAQDKTIG